MVIDRVEQLSAYEVIDEIVYGEVLFEWGTGEPILIRSYCEDVTPLLHPTVNEESKGNIGLDVIIFVE